MCDTLSNDQLNNCERQLSLSQELFWSKISCHWRCEETVQWAPDMWTLLNTLIRIWMEVWKTWSIWSEVWITSLTPFLIFDGGNGTTQFLPWRNTLRWIAVNTTKKPRIYSKTTNKSVHPALTSPKRKGRLSKHSRKMTHGLSSLQTSNKFLLRLFIWFTICYGTLR